jgi:hemolysin activation/secretion protein
VLHGTGRRQVNGSLARCGRQLAGLTLLSSLAANVAAQPATQAVPPTREEVTQPIAPPRPPESRLEVEGGIARTPCALDGPEFQSIRFTLRSADFEGLQGLTSADLAPSFAPYVGREVPISTVCEIRDRAAAILHDAGYIAAVQVPQQRIEGGVVRFQVLLAHLTQVRVRGEASGAEAVLAAYLGRLTRRPLFNRFEAERYLLLASDLPGYTVRLTLRPAGTAPGDVIGDVTVQRLPAYADFVVQNGGSQALGPWGGLVRGELFGLTGLADRTIFSVYSTPDLKEQQTVQIAHDMRLGSDGMGLAGSFTYAWARPTVPNATVLARTLFMTTELSYPFVRRQLETVRGSVGLDFVNQTVKVDHANVSRDRLRVLFGRLGIDAVGAPTPGYSAAIPPWHLNGLFELRQGLRVLGATPDCTNVPCTLKPSRTGGKSDATLVRFTGVGELRPAPKFTLALAARVQYAWKSLLSFEQFAGGNYTVGRGYDPGAIIGDSGFGTQLEMRYGSRVAQSARKPAIEGYGFWDEASVSNRDHISSTGGSEHLNSVGTGVRMSWQRFSLDTSFAVPLTRVGFPSRRPGPRLLISLTTRLWPWTY